MIFYIKKYKKTENNTKYSKYGRLAFWEEEGCQLLESHFSPCGFVLNGSLINAECKKDPEPLYETKKISTPAHPAVLVYTTDSIMYDFHEYTDIFV